MLLHFSFTYQTFCHDACHLSRTSADIHWFWDSGQWVTNGKHSSVQNCDIMQNISAQVLRSACYSSCRKPSFRVRMSVGEYLATFRMVLVPPFSGRTLITWRDLPSATVFRENSYYLTWLAQRHGVTPRSSTAVRTRNLAWPVWCCGDSFRAEEDFLGVWRSCSVIVVSAVWDPIDSPHPSAETDHVCCKLQRK